MSSGQIAAVEVEEICFHFRVGEELTAHTLPSIRRGLLHRLNCCRDVEVDFSEVSIVDTKSVRAILAIRHEALRKNKALHFVSRSEAFLKLLNLMNHAFFDADLAV